MFCAACVKVWGRLQHRRYAQADDENRQILRLDEFFDRAVQRDDDEGGGGGGVGGKHTNMKKTGEREKRGVRRAVGGGDSSRAGSVGGRRARTRLGDITNTDVRGGVSSRVGDR